MRKYINDALVRDLTVLVHKHRRVTGREFQHSALFVAGAYYESEDTDNFCTVEDMLKVFTTELKNSLNNDYEAIADQDSGENGKERDPFETHAIKQQ